MNTATIVLAAGQSMRFGLADKLSLPIAGIALIARTLAGIREATDGPIVLVLGRQPRRHIRALAQQALLGPRLRICHNRHPDHGLGSSLAVGLRAMPSVVSCVDIHLADMPLVDRCLLYRLHRALTPSIDVARAAHNGQPGHPVRVRRALLAGLPLANPDSARDRIRSVSAGRRATVQGPVTCSQDIDTRQTGRTLIARWQRRGLLEPV